MELTMQIIQQYLTACADEKKLNPKTIKAYRIDLRQFWEYLNETNSRFDREAIKAYVSEMNRKFKPRTVKRKIAAIRALVTWLMGERRMDRNPFENLRIKVQEPLLLPRVIPLRVIGKILEAAHHRLRQKPDDSAALCETAVLETLFATGIRVSELSGLDVRDVDLNDGILRIFGKGSKERIIHITNPEVLAILRKYSAKYNMRSGPFFRNRRGNRLSEQSIRRIVRKYGEAVDSPTRITPHMFRHSVATLFLEEDVDIRCIQQILGHASILTTQIYTHVAGGKQREIMETRHPRNRFSFPGEGTLSTPDLSGFLNENRKNCPDNSIFDGRK